MNVLPASTVIIQRRQLTMVKNIFLKEHFNFFQKIYDIKRSYIYHT